MLIVAKACNASSHHCHEPPSTMCACVRACVCSSVDKNQRIGEKRQKERVGRGSTVWVKVRNPLHHIINRAWAFSWLGVHLLRPCKINSWDRGWRSKRHVLFLLRDETNSEFPAPPWKGFLSEFFFFFFYCSLLESLMPTFQWFQQKQCEGLSH